MRAVQYHPDYCDEAKADAEANGWCTPWRWDISHEVSLIMSDGSRVKVGSFPGAEAAHRAGEWIKANTSPDDWESEPHPAVDDCRKPAVYREEAIDIFGQRHMPLTP